MASSANDSANATTTWYESIEVYSSDYEPSTFEPGSSVDANHDLLAGLRDNDFEMANSSYTVSFPRLHRCSLRMLSFDTHSEDSSPCTAKALF